MRNPNDKEKIKGLFLGKCINEYIDDPRLKSTAEKAVWLGNDEAHYIKKWEDKDIADLKVLIRLSCIWVESILLTEQYDTEMT